MESKPLAIDLYCGLGGWTEGLLAAGYDVIGFDNERHEYGDHRYPAQLVLQDVRTIDGSRFADVDLIVASPPCTEYSYMAMPWSRAKQIARALRSCGDFPEDYTGSRTLAELTELFDACFRIQAEASKAAGRRIPLVVENVCGAQTWVGRARWHYGSFYLWGDVPALMPIVRRAGVKVGGLDWKHPDAQGQAVRERRMKGGKTKDGKHWERFTADGIKQGGTLRQHSSKSPARKAASAMIAKIPFELARWIGRAWLPQSKAA